MSEAVERRLLDLLGHPTESPYGNPIPGLEELGESDDAASDLAGLVSADTLAAEDTRRVTVRRIGEPLQDDSALMLALRRAGVGPGAVVKLRLSPGGVLLGSAGEYAELDLATAAHVFVERPAGPGPA